MARYPGALWNPLPNGGPMATAPTTIVVHSNAGHSDDIWGTLNAQGLSAHFQVQSDGTVHQYVDTEQVAWANVEANAFAISIETENSVGYPNDPTFDTDVWPARQREALLALLDWCCKTHGIARQVCTAETGGGIGWHEQFSQWTTAGHHCPGTARVQQLHDDIIPALQPQGVFMALNDAEQQELLDTVRRIDKRTWQVRQADDSRWRRLLAKFGVK